MFFFGKLGGYPLHFFRTPRVGIASVDPIWREISPESSLSTSDLQKSRHSQKSRVTERHNRGTKRNLKSHPLAQKKREAPFFGSGAASLFALCPDCAVP